MKSTQREGKIINREKEEKEQMDIASVLFRYRWVIGLVLMILCVGFQLSGSSIGMWNSCVPDSNTVEEPLIAGVDRPIRSDEWNLFTPMALSQYYNDFGMESSILRGTSTDVYMVYGQCINDWSMIFRPFQTGYLFLSPARGLSFYWCGKLIVLFLVSLEFGLLTTNRRKYLSLAYAFLVAFAPVVQWWFSINAFPDMLVYGQGLMLCLAAYMETKSYCNRIILALCMSWLSGCYLLVMYPAWQIPFFYVFLAVGVWIIGSRAKQMSFTAKKDIPVLIGAVLLLAVCMTLIVIRSWDAIYTVMNTIYPGQRFETGGGGIAGLLRYIANPIFPYYDINIPVNVCELASFYDLFPLGLLMSVFLFRKKRDGFTLSVLIGIVFLTLYVAVGFPDVIAKATLLSKSTEYRCVAAISYCNLLLLIRSLFIIHEELHIKTIDNRRAIAGVTFLALFVFVCSYLFVYRGYYTVIVGTICAAALCIAYLSCIRNERSFLIVICAVSIAMGATVNPIRAGLTDIYSNSLGQTIERIAEQDDSNWLVVSDNWAMGNYPIMFGARTINCTNTYTNRDLWNILDPDGLQEETYNRYTYIVTKITDDEIVKAEIIHPVIIELDINPEIIPQIGVKYILSEKDLALVRSDTVSFKRVFTQEEGLYSIYCVESQ